MRVMIVEDQTMIRSLLESYFRAEEGHQIVASIPGAKQAVEICRTSSDRSDFDGCSDRTPGKRLGRCASN